MNRLFIVLGLVTIGIVSLLMAVSGRFESTQDQMTIVTTFYPITALTKPILGEVAVLTQLVPSGQGPHDYRPKPSDIETIKKADLLIINGAGLESEWLESLVESAGRRDLRILNLADVVVASGLPLLILDQEGEADLRTDPHLWLSPRTVGVIVSALADELIAVDPVYAAAYRTNAETFSTRLSELDIDITQRVASFSSRTFIAFHDAFSYFSRDYGLTQVAAIELAPGEAPSPGKLAQIQQLVRSLKLRALFTEPQFTSATVEQLAQDLGVQILVLDPMETNERGEDYIEAMRRNLDALEQALK